MVTTIMLGPRFSILFHWEKVCVNDVAALS